MTIKEALNQRIPRVRLAKWANPGAYLRLPLMADGAFGPWAELYDKWGQDACEIREGSQRVCVLLGDHGEDYEPYTGAASEMEKHPENYARSYVES